VPFPYLPSKHRLKSVISGRAQATASPPLTGAQTSIIFWLGAVAIAICVTPLAAQTGQITGITVHPSPATVGRQVTITVNGTGYCRVTIDTGEPLDPTAKSWGNHIYDINSLDDRPPWISGQWSYDRPGIYRIIATPSISECTGRASVTLTVVARPTQKFGTRVGSGRSSGLGAVTPGGFGRTSGSGRPLSGSDNCKPGFVWREAVPADHVCVSVQTRDQTRLDNATAAGRTVPRSDVCKQGFVWREAFSNDRACVTPQTRAAAADDNRHAAERRLN